MRRRQESPSRDKPKPESLRSDIQQALSGALRQARLRKHLSQEELAGRLGLRQRQISDLERATFDPRLSTIQNVARALDLDLMLVPSHLISAVEALQRAGRDAASRPMYALGDDEASGDEDDEAHVEIGETREPGGPADRAPDPRKGQP